MISVIIPTYNEAEHLPATLASLRGSREPHEIFVVDAGSRDDTATVARNFGVRVLTSSEPQRAAQMNNGARASQGETLLFLHADTRLAPNALFTITAALRDPAIVGGGFARRYDSASPFLRLTCALAEIRTQCFGWFLGDQAIFVRRRVFDELEGFRPWDIFEDLDFSRRMAREGRVVTLRPSVISAGRRFYARGAMRTTWKDFCLTMRYLRGDLKLPLKPVSPPIRPHGVDEISR